MPRKKKTADESAAPRIVLRATKIMGDRRRRREEQKAREALRQEQLDAEKPKE